MMMMITMMMMTMMMMITRMVMMTMLMMILRLRLIIHTPHSPIYLVRFIFEYLDHASYGDEALEQFESRHLIMGKDKATSTIIGGSKKETKSKSEVALKGLRLEDTDELLRPGGATKKNKNKKTSSDTNRGFGLKKNT